MSKILPGCSVLPPLDPLVPGAPRGGRAAGKSAGGNRFAVLNAFVDATLRSLNKTEAKVWLILFRDTKRDGLVRASDASLAQRAGVSARSVWTARRRLEALGLVEVVRRGRFRGGASVYRVRALTAEASCEIRQEAGCETVRKPASVFPEGDQKGRCDPSGSHALRESAKRGARRRSL